MKTKVNQMVLTAILAIVLVSGNVNATEKEAIVVSGLENIAETKLELEGWMVNDTYWVKSGAEQVLEENLMLEQWMIDEDNWKVTANEDTLVDAEKQLVLENWMTSNSFWN